jgi:putative addiction module component (TIGR02574 family)
LAILAQFSAAAENMAQCGIVNGAQERWRLARQRQRGDLSEDVCYHHEEQSLQGRQTVSALFKELEDEAMRLPARSRAQLAQRLLASLDQELAGPDAEKLWVAEAQRRAEELASGKVKAIPARQVLKKARAALR